MFRIFRDKNYKKTSFEVEELRKALNDTRRLHEDIIQRMREFEIKYDQDMKMAKECIQQKSLERREALELVKRLRNMYVPNTSNYFNEWK